MTKGNRKKMEMLGTNYGTAFHRLRKMIMFDFAKKLNLDTCYQCGHKIDDINEFSIEHKTPWLNSELPLETFYDINNIAFSHLSCNAGAAKQTVKAKHPSLYNYKMLGCRCEECTKLNTESKRKQRASLKENEK